MRHLTSEYNYNYYGFPYYWTGDEIWGPVTLPRDLIAEDMDRKFVLTEEVNQSHLRSMKEVTGYSIQATDGEIGHVEDFIIDDETWAIRYLIINTQNWWPGKKVLVSPQWIERVSWIESKVFVNLTCETIRQSPEYTEESLLTRDYETELHRHYNRRGYWVDEPAGRK